MENLGTVIIGVISVSIVMLIALATGFWGLLKAISAKFESMNTKMDVNNTTVNNAITELRVNQAAVGARQDSLESFVKSLPQLLAQMMTASHLSSPQNPHNTDA